MPHPSFDPDPSLATNGEAVLINQYNSAARLSFSRVLKADGSDAGLVRVTQTDAVGKVFDLDRNQLSDHFNAWIDAESRKALPREKPAVDLGGWHAG